MVEVHEVDIRMKYVLRVVHHLLIALLQYAIKNHPDCITKTDPDIGLSEIISKCEQKFRQRRALLKDHYVNFFYDSTTGHLKKSIDIKRLDFLVICTILRTSLLTKFRQLLGCCGGCLHNCTICGTSPCLGNVECVLETCPSYCGCHYEVVMYFVFIARALRNTNAHSVYQNYVDLVDKRTALQGFSSCNRWRDIWEIMNKACMDCLGYLQRYKVLTAEEVKDQEMDLWFSLRKEQNYLLPIVGTFMKQCWQLISDEQETASRLTDIEQLIKNQNKYCFIKDEQYYDFLDATRQIQFNVEVKSNKKCILVCDEVSDVIGVQYQKPLKLFRNVPYNISNELGKTYVTIHCLKANVRYNFRMLAHTPTAGEDTELTHISIKNVSIKEYSDEDFVEIDGQEICIDDYLKTGLELKTTTSQGAVFLFEREGTAIRKAEVRLTGSSKWSTANYKNNGSNYYEIGGDLNEDDIYDFRVFADVGNQKHLLTTSNVQLNECKHAHIIHDVLMVSHPFGSGHDARIVLENLPRCPASGSRANQIKFEIKGMVHTRSVSDIDAKKYLRKNFHEPTLVMPRSYQLDKDEIIQPLMKKLENVLSNQKTFLFTHVNFYKHLETIGYTRKNIEKEFTIDFKECCNNIVFYPPDMQCVVVITLPEAQKYSIHHLFKRSNLNTSVYLRLHQHLFQNQDFSILSVVGAISSTKDELMHYCGDCKDTILTQDDVSSEDSINEWLSQLKKMLNHQQNSACLQQNISFESIQNKAGYLAILEGVVDDRFPSLIAKDDEVIHKMVLSPKQREVLVDPELKKIITGPYGSGKSVLIHQWLQDHVKRAENPIYYIGFDEYTLYQIQMEQFCEQISKESSSRLICSNVVDFSSGNTVSTLLECLEDISSKHKNETVDVIVDEYDSEELTRDQALKIKTALETRTFANASVIIAVQSCQKKRSVQHEQETVDHESHCFEGTGMKTLQLTNTMRMTSRIHDVVEASQQQIESLANVYNVPEKSSAGTVERPEKSTTESNVVTDVSLASPIAESQSTVDVISNSKEDKDEGGEQPQQSQHEEQEKDQHFVDDELEELSERSMTIPTPKLDALFIGISEDHSQSKIVSKFEYLKNSLCGHEIKGDHIPELLRLDSESEKNVRLLNYLFIKTSCSGEKTMVICNTPELLPFVRCALKSAGIQFVEYTDSIRQIAAHKSPRKKAVLDSWLCGPRQVLLVDARGCRGMEYKKVVLILDLADYHGRHFMAEAVSRATSELSIVAMTTKKDQEVNESNLKDVIEMLVKENLLSDVTDEYSIKSTSCKVLPIDSFEEDIPDCKPYTRVILDKKVNSLMSNIKSKNRKDIREYEETEITWVDDELLAVEVAKALIHTGDGVYESQKDIYQLFFDLDDDLKQRILAIGSSGEVSTSRRYWMKLRLLLEILKDALLATFHNHTQTANFTLSRDPVQLRKELEKHRNKLKILNPWQRSYIFSTSIKETDSSKFDVYMLVTLIDRLKLYPEESNVLGIARKAGALKKFLNENKENLDESEFEAKWSEGEDILNSLSYTYDTEKLKRITDLKERKPIKPNVKGEDNKRLQYDRDFLLKYQFAPICTSKPTNLPDIDIVLDKPHLPTKPLVPGQRIINNFMPEYMRPPSGGGGRSSGGGRSKDRKEPHLPTETLVPEEITTRDNINIPISFGTENINKPIIFGQPTDESHHPIGESESVRQSFLDKTKHVQPLINQMYVADPQPRAEQQTRAPYQPQYTQEKTQPMIQTGLPLRTMYSKPNGQSMPMRGAYPNALRMYVPVQQDVYQNYIPQHSYQQYQQVYNNQPPQYQQYQQVYNNQPPQYQQYQQVYSQPQYGQQMYVEPQRPVYAQQGLSQSTHMKQAPRHAFLATSQQLHHVPQQQQQQQQPQQQQAHPTLETQTQPKKRAAIKLIDPNTGKLLKKYQ